MSINEFPIPTRTVQLQKILDAEVEAQNAANSAAAALTSEQNAATSETNAGTSASAALTSEQNALASEQAAATSEQNAATSETNAGNSAAAALTSEQNALTSEQNAASSASAALTSEQNAGTSETNASNSAAAALTSEQNADASAIDASNSAAAALTSEQNASTSEANALTSEQNAATSETNAGNSASAALTSEQNAAGSALAALTSEQNALASEQAASTSEANALTSEQNAATSEQNAEVTFNNFDERYLGAKASPPELDNSGNPLITGALYFDTTANQMRVYDGNAWVDAGSAVNGTSERNVYVATAGQTTFAVTYDIGFVDVYLNGVKLTVNTDFTATSGVDIVLASGATEDDIIDIVAYGAFNVADTFTQAQSDARYLRIAENLSDLNDAEAARNNLGLEIGVDVEAFDATILKSADIGVTVQEFDVTILKSDDIGVTVQGFDADTVKTDATQTLTNKTIDGDDNTLVNVSKVFQATVEGSDGTSDWTGSDPSIATITVTGLLASDVPIVDLDLSSVLFADVEAVQTDWALVYRVEASDDDELKLYATAEPAESFELTIKVVR